MTIKQTLKLVNYIKWLFLIWIVVLMVTIFTGVPNIEISQIGTVIFLGGIYMGLESLGDSAQLTDKEKKFYSKTKNIKIQTYLITTSAVALLIISIFFILLEYIFPDLNKSLGTEFSNLGFDCLAMMLGFLCLLKQLRDKAETYNSLNNSK